MSPAVSTGGGLAQQSLSDRLLDERLDRRSGRTVRARHGERSRLGCLPDQSSLGVDERRAVLEEQVDSLVARVDGADVACLGMVEADPAPAAIDTFDEIRIRREHGGARPDGELEV